MGDNKKTSENNQMTIGDLKKHIKDFPDDLFVYIKGFPLLDAGIITETYEDGEKDTYVALV